MGNVALNYPVFLPPAHPIPGIAVLVYTSSFRLSNLEWQERSYQEWMMAPLGQAFWHLTSLGPLTGLH